MHIVFEETSLGRKMPHRYPDVNIKLHQYQGWKSGGISILRGFKETLLIGKRENKHCKDGGSPRAQNRDIILFLAIFCTNKKPAVMDLPRFDKLKYVQNVFMEQEVDQTAKIQSSAFPG